MRVFMELPCAYHPLAQKKRTGSHCRQELRAVPATGCGMFATKNAKKCGNFVTGLEAEKSQFPSRANAFGLYESV